MVAAAIQGTFADLKTVKTRSVVQMVIEIPIEQGAMIIDAFGFPRPGEEVPVAVARLDPSAVKTPPVAPEKVKRAFKDYTLSQQAGMRCGDANFAKYVDTITPGVFYNDPADFVRAYCSVVSRSHLDTEVIGGGLWRDLNAAYEVWAGLETEQR